jgi:hypothetical protein
LSENSRFRTNGALFVNRIFSIMISSPMGIGVFFGNNFYVYPKLCKSAIIIENDLPMISKAPAGRNITTLHVFLALFQPQFLSQIARQSIFVQINVDGFVFEIILRNKQITFRVVGCAPRIFHQIIHRAVGFFEQTCDVHAVVVLRGFIVVTFLTQFGRDVQFFHGLAECV